MMGKCETPFATLNSLWIHPRGIQLLLNKVFNGTMLVDMPVTLSEVLMGGGPSRSRRVKEQRGDGAL